MTKRYDLWYTYLVVTPAKAGAQSFLVVILAKAEIHLQDLSSGFPIKNFGNDCKSWIPAFAGMTS